MTLGPIVIYSNTLNDESREIKIENILHNPLFYKDYPPIVSPPNDTQKTLKPGEIPDYVIKYAPWYIFMKERYFPYDVKKFVTNFMSLGEMVQLILVQKTI